VYQFGPHNPRAVWLCAWLPMLWISVGWAGFVTATLGWTANVLLMNQTMWRPARKAAATLAVSLATVPAASLLGLSVHDWYRDVSGQEALTPSAVGFGVCVDTSGGTGVEVELVDVTRCSGRHDGEVVFVTTLGSSAAHNARFLGPMSFCQQAAEIRLSSPVVQASYRIRVATDGDDVAFPKAGDSWACVVERTDGRQMSEPFSCADREAADDSRCRDKLFGSR
jgi:hypothetical protein